MDSAETTDARRLCDEGFALLEAGRYEQAKALLDRARFLSPDNPLVHFRLALLYVDTGDPAGALVALDLALELDPRNARAHNNRGSVLEMLGQFGEAEHAFRRAIEIDGDLAQPYSNLGHLLEKQGKTDQTIALYERAITRGVERERFSQQLAAVLGKSTDRAPDEWVRVTFDNFAPAFDARLAALGYDAPRKLASMLDGRTPASCDIVDLGCGTGQCGVALAKSKRHLSGVDLSPKMLAFARERGVYDELYTGEVGAWLASAGDASVDVVVAADVFIYIGALESLFHDVARVLRPRGWFAFSTEESEGADYVLRASGRYAQSQAYIARLTGTSFLTVVTEACVIRTESGAPIAGRLYLLRRS